METDVRQGTLVRVEETRRRVEWLVVEEKRQASGLLRTMADKARGGWEKMRKVLDGKKIVWRGSTGKIVVIDENAVVGEGEGEIGFEEEMEGGTVEMVGEEADSVERKADSGASATGGSCGGWSNMWEKIEVKERDKELEEQLSDSRKRKRDDGEGKAKKVGLCGLPGWERRSRTVRDSERWKRKVVRLDVGRNGNMERTEGVKTIPVPEELSLGKEGKGLEMNNSGRLRNNFGLNREGLFPTGPGMKSETRNWLASFTKAGCVSCRDEQGVLNHKGRDGHPGVLIVGDETIPSTVGYTG
jgi:hypothetical protein